jgi:hypothetical protein
VLPAASLESEAGTDLTLGATSCMTLTPTEGSKSVLLYGTHRAGVGHLTPGPHGRDVEAGVALADSPSALSSPRVHRTPGISCERSIRSTLVSFIPLFGVVVIPSLASLASTA